MLAASKVRGLLRSGIQARINDNFHFERLCVAVLLDRKATTYSLQDVRRVGRKMTARPGEHEIRSERKCLSVKFQPQSHNVFHCNVKSSEEYPAPSEMTVA
jgi:hypothetical protein